MGAEKVVLGTMAEFGMSPDATCFNTLIRAYGRDASPENKERMWAVFEKMKKSGVQFVL